MLDRRIDRAEVAGDERRELGWAHADAAPVTVPLSQMPSCRPRPAAPGVKKGVGRRSPFTGLKGRSLLCLDPFRA